MPFEVKATKLDPHNLQKTEIFEEFLLAKKSALKRARESGVVQSIKPTKGTRFESYLITPDGQQINNRTKTKWRIRE